MDNKTKDKIVSRLHNLVGVCMTCKKRDCGHGKNTMLPPRIDTDVILRAINLDEHFFKEEQSDESD